MQSVQNPPGHRDDYARFPVFMVEKPQFGRSVAEALWRRQPHRMRRAVRRRPETVSDAAASTTKAAPA
jgi:hypothetical protein